MRGFAAIGLHAPKDRHNVGAALRAAWCYGAQLVLIGGAKRIGGLTKASTDTFKSWRHIPSLLVDDLLESVPLGAVPVAVDLVPDAVPPGSFQHPERAFYIFGPEDGTLGRSITDRCPHKVMVPTRGCMNLAASVNVILYDRQTKRMESTTHDR